MEARRVRPWFSIRNPKSQIRNPAFTLVEVLAVTAIVGLIAVASVTIVNGLLAAKGRVDAQYTAQQEARAVAGIMAEALRNAVRPSDPRRAVMVGEDAWVGDLPADRVKWFAVDDAAVRADQPESDVRELEVFVMHAGEETPPLIVRRSDPTRNAGDEVGGVLDRLTSRASGLNVAYFDGLAWRDEWPAGSGWPVAARVEVLVVDDRPGVAPWRAERLVSWPGWTRQGARAATGAATPATSGNERGVER